MNSMPDLENYQYLPEPIASDENRQQRAKSEFVPFKKDEAKEEIEIKRSTIGWIIINDFIRKPFRVQTKIYMKTLLQLESGKKIDFAKNIRDSIIEPSGLLDEIILEKIQNWRNKYRLQQKPAEVEEKKEIQKEKTDEETAQEPAPEKKKKYILPRIVGSILGVMGGPAFMNFAADTLEKNYAKFKVPPKQQVTKPVSPKNNDEEQDGLLKQQTEDLQKKEFVDIVL